MPLKTRKRLDRSTFRRRKRRAPVATLNQPWHLCGRIDYLVEFDPGTTTMPALMTRHLPIASTLGWVFLVMAATGVQAQETPIAFSGATLIPIRGEPVSNAVLVVHRGRIVAAGPAPL